MQPYDYSGFASFQFHKGAIRTICPTMMFSHVLHFNSIKVRLEPSIIADGFSVSASFQFHKGAIRTI